MTDQESTHHAPSDPRLLAALDEARRRADAVSINHNAMHTGVIPVEEHPFSPIVEAVREIAAEVSGARVAAR